MARIKIEVPEEFIFSTSIPVRITDLNYGGHVGNDTVLSIMHEARVQFLKSHGYQELDFAGVGLIMSDVSIDFKSELFYGDTVEAHLAIGDLTGVAFDLYYKLEKSKNGQTVPVAFAKTGMVCYDYQRKKIVALPAEARTRLGGNVKQVK
jgi:acyl-CoA thioester hydrolase